MTAQQERTINRLADEVIRAEERGDTRSAEFLTRCLLSAIRHTPAPRSFDPAALWLRAVAG